MNEEENKAIKYFYNLRATIDECKMLFDEGINVKCGKEMIKQITTVINLLEKKDRQIEELEKRLCNHDEIISRLEEDNTNWRGKYLIELAKVSDLEKGYRELDEMTAVKYSSIQRDAYYRGRAEEQQRAEQIIYENYIPKSKIKEKIEKLNKKYKGIESNYTEEELDSGDEGLDDYIEMQKIQMANNILQELLEEE